ncbi:hypothetical protein RFI_32950 [Reticulomyxa filosa]|uniref:Uncharacterized protein n=1 Tax=Reticulomyxa filosa TaxID=46433 RepID=X6LRG0_RETFI|nr:hypothetical protein RFI_32950 [Reticulomyxa filosa]|eukprot:ETO04448.1 hypothetical protein RFI_32950 [Reticulomyxa filosa]
MVTKKKTEGPNCASAFFPYDNNWFSAIRAEILAPNRCIYRDEKEEYFEYEKAAATSEVGVILIVAVMFVMILLITIAWRSKNPFITDWFRIIAIYAAGKTFHHFCCLFFFFYLKKKVMVPYFFFFLYTYVLFFWIGFVGFAVVIHNFAELYLLRVVWFGQKANSFIGNTVIVLYAFLMTTFLAFLPMNGLYVLAMVQGSTMDYLFCVSFPVIATKFLPHRYNFCDFILAASAAIIHILSLQPLFLGFAFANSQITGITTLGLFPTFFLYTYFAGRELGRFGFLGPSFQELLNYFWAMRVLRNLRAIKTEIPLQNIAPATEKPQDNKALETQVELANQHENIKITSIMADDAVILFFIYYYYYFFFFGISFKRVVEAITQASGEADQVASDSDKGRARDFAQKGAIEYFNMPNWQVVLVFFSALALSLANSIIIWYSPCFVSDSIICKA